VDAKQILALNAFDPSEPHDLGPALEERVRQRARLFGAASVLFYDKPLEFVRGEGCRLYDAGGTAYLDAYNNVPSMGHCHPKIVAAVARQLGLLNIHSRYLHEGVSEYAQKLLSTLPASLSTITFTCTGSESNDLALRLAANVTGARGVIVTEAAYHGNTGLVSDVSPSLFLPDAPPAHVRLVPAPDAARAGPGELSALFAGHVSAAIADLTRCGVGLSALLVDSIFSSDGVYADPPGFLHAAVEAVHRAGGLFIADEVQCGFGRTGAALWGFERHAVQPDIVTLGKPMGNGYPIGGVVTRPEILEALCAKVGYFNTFAGSPAAAAAGQAVLEVLEQERLMENALRVGEHLKGALADLSTRHAAIAAVRGAGLYIGVELRADGVAGRGVQSPRVEKRAVQTLGMETRGVQTPGVHTPAAGLAKAVINGLRERRVLIGAAGKFGNVLKIRPPLCFSAADADHLVGALDGVLEELARRKPAGS
jgi:4-aminobutyrate aminotransferase-like enzyme